jgi:hypothetical protein
VAVPERLLGALAGRAARLSDAIVTTSQQARARERNPAEARRAALRYTRARFSARGIPGWICQSTEYQMIRSRRTLVVTLLAALGIAAGAGTASARTAYDGIWSVVVAAEGGACSGAYRYPVAIVNGYVRHADPSDQSFNVNGRVGPGGRVSVQVSRGDQRAYGAGQLSRSAGGGSWRSPNGCAGHWQAARRG